jgi:hypothetical protein
MGRTASERTGATRAVTEPQTPSGPRPHADLVVLALARYVEALDRRYPDGPSELRREGLDARAKVSGMVRIRKDPAA